MSTINTGGQAFPGLDRGGMTLRDYLAAKALQGICASSPGSEWSNEILAREAYALADAMLEARKL